MSPLFAGSILESALIGGAIGAGVGLVAGVILLLMPKKPCPRCGKPLPKSFVPAKACPHCKCKFDAKGQPVDDKGQEA